MIRGQMQVCIQIEYTRNALPGGVSAVQGALRGIELQDDVSQPATADQQDGLLSAQRPALRGHLPDGGSRVRVGDYSSYDI